MIRVWYRGRAAEGGAAGGAGAAGTGGGAQGGGTHQGGEGEGSGDQAGGEGGQNEGEGEGEGEGEQGEGAEQDAESEARLNALNRETEGMLDSLGDDPEAVTDEELTDAEKTYANLLAQNPDNAEVRELYERIVALRQARTNTSSVLPEAPSGNQQGGSPPAPVDQGAQPSFAPLDTFTPSTILQTAPAPAPAPVAVAPNVSQHAAGPIGSATSAPVNTLQGPVSQPVSVTTSRPQPPAPTQTATNTFTPAADNGNLPIYRPSTAVSSNNDAPEPPSPKAERSPASQPEPPAEATVTAPAQPADSRVVSRRTYEDTRGNTYPTAAEAALESGLPPPPPTAPITVVTSVTVGPSTSTATVAAPAEVEPAAPVAVAVEPPSYEPVAAPSGYAALPDPVDAARAFTPVVAADPEPAPEPVETRFVETGRGIITTGGMEPISFDEEPAAPVRAAVAVRIGAGDSVAFAENSYNPPPALLGPEEEPFVDFPTPKANRAPVKLIGGMPAISATPPETPSRAISAESEDEGLGQFADFIRVELRKSAKAPIPAAKTKKPASPPPPAQGFLSKLISRFLF